MHTLIRSTGKGAMMGAALLFIAPLARAQDGSRPDEVEADEPAPTLAPGLQLALKVEPGLAIPLTTPQTDIYDVGGGQTVKLLFGLTSYLDIGPSASFTMLSADDEMADAGTAWTVGGGARIMRPHDGAGGFLNLSAMSPWFDADVMYVRTGELDRPGFAMAAGVATPLDENRHFWLGPFVRYSHIIQGDRAGFDNGDAMLLNVGLSLEVGRGVEHARAVAHEVRVVREVVTAPPPPNPDRDGDGVTNQADHCPDVAGEVQNIGCPLYGKVIVKRDKLELTEKIAFEWDSAKLEDASFPLLDEVVRALQDAPGFRVQVEGHTSSEGQEAHNQSLSEQRAAAVLDYLAAHGVAKERLVSKGFSSSVPLNSNETPEGREENRRVEFVVHFIIVKEGSTP